MQPEKAPPKKPMRPVPRGCAAGFFRGRYKVRPEDFVVEELPAYEPSGSGDHVWLWVEKRGWSTMDLLHDLAARLGRDEREFGIAGLKDAQAVSRQWISLEHADVAACEGLAGDGWQVQRVTRHGNKLRMGHLRGNRFVVTLRGTAPGDLDKATANLGELARRGVPNYFGEQRFGKRGANLGKGLEVLRGNARQYAARMPRRVFGLVLSAVQSEVFNRVVAARLQTLDQLLVGDIAFLHRNGASFAVEDVAAEQARVAAFELSPTGPMPGPEMPLPTGEVAAIEAAALAALDLQPEAFAKLPFRLARGERRPLRVPLGDPAAAVVDGGLQLTFGLPRGAYATSVLRELLEDTIWFGRD
ncbi:MAG: tRNA pseudouridine(13) synthase TruD [Planctomycetes bacterium]|nr:tRNA pseudouridine(13) synthase TruD [Planctomycetota bacterium]MCB9885193.1 tRNA pseudouridine(13) synthase TruD [Planctomycetota bacterium]